MKGLRTSAKFLLWVVPIVAVLMLGLMLTPAEVWHHPANDAVYEGFDLNLIYVDEKGYSPSPGMIEVAPNCLKLTALPGSQPTVHLVTTPLKRLQVTMNASILRNELGTDPLHIGIWSPRTASGYFLEFGLPPENLISAKTLAEGGVTQTLVGGKIIKNEALGSYDPGQIYRLKIDLDKEEGIITSSIESVEMPPTGERMLRLATSDEAENRDVISEPVPVKEGEEYSFGGLVKMVSKADAYKIDIEWLNKDLHHMDYVKNWRSTQELNGWTRMEFKARAPQDAAFARVLLGVSDESEFLFADIFLRKAGSLANLLPNGDFRRGAEGWTKVDQPSSLPEITDPYPVFLDSSVTVAEAPDLFDSLRVSLTVSTASQTGIAMAVLDNYVLTLPHQRWQVVEVDDVRARVLVVALLLVGGLLVVGRACPWVCEKVRHRSGRILRYIGRFICDTPFAMRIGLFVVIFLVLNALLFSLGSLPFDMMIQKVWAYCATKYSPLELYYLPNLVSLAKVWGGTPYQEAVFPYNFGFTYLFVLIGWIYKLFLKGPGPLVMDTFALEFAIKSFNVLFTLADGMLIYLILRELKVGRQQSVLASGLLLFNPAVWFIGSIWGQTHLISVFFVLASIWLAERRHLQWAWLALAVGVLNRPQMLVPLFLLGLIFLRKFLLRENLRSICWSVIAVFLFLGPFSLAISPSMPLDVLTNQLFMQEAGGNEPALTTVSLDTYNLWPLITYTQGARGLSRIYYPSASTLIAELSYQRISQILTLGIVLTVAILILVRREWVSEFGDYIPLLTLGTVGFLIFKTGLASTHFVLALPLLILCRRYIGRTTWYSLVAIWTATMLVPMYGVFGFAIENLGHLAPALHSSNNVITRSFMGLYSADWFITLGSFANLVVLVWLGVKVIQQLWPRQQCARVVAHDSHSYP